MVKSALHEFKNIYSMLFAGREVRIGKNRALGLEYGPRSNYRGPHSRPRAQFFPILTDLGQTLANFPRNTS